MCRNIRPLFHFEPAVSDGEIKAAATQYVRKVSGFSKPSAVNEAVFDKAIVEIAHATQHLLADLVTAAPYKDRDIETAKARARMTKRFGTT